MRLIPVIVTPDLVDGSKLRLEHDFVDGTLLGREFAVYRKCPRDVRRVVVEFATGVDEQQIAVLQLGELFST